MGAEGTAPVGVGTEETTPVGEGTDGTAPVCVGTVETAPMGVETEGTRTLGLGTEGTAPVSAAVARTASVMLFVPVLRCVPQQWPAQRLSCFSCLFSDVFRSSGQNSGHHVILNADGVYLATYAALSLDLRLVRAGHYVQPTLHPLMSEVSNF